MCGGAVKLSGRLKGPTKHSKKRPQGFPTNTDLSGPPKKRTKSKGKPITDNEASMEDPFNKTKRKKKERALLDEPDQA
jgi:hypothetical protein